MKIFYIFKYDGEIYCEFFNEKFWNWCKDELNKNDVRYESGIL